MTYVVSLGARTDIARSLPQRMQQFGFGTWTLVSAFGCSKGMSMKSMLLHGLPMNVMPFLAERTVPSEYGTSRQDPAYACSKAITLMSGTLPVIKAEPFPAPMTIRCVFGIFGVDAVFVFWKDILGMLSVSRGA